MHRIFCSGSDGYIDFRPLQCKAFATCYFSTTFILLLWSASSLEAIPLLPFVFCVTYYFIPMVANLHGTVNTYSLYSWESWDAVCVPWKRWRVFNGWKITFAISGFHCSTVCLGWLCVHLGGHSAYRGVSLLNTQPRSQHSSPTESRFNCSTPYEAQGSEAGDTAVHQVAELWV